MKTIQMTLEDELLVDVDKVVALLETTRSAFIRQALRDALRQHALRQLEVQHRRGYGRIPPEIADVVEWENEQAWGAEA